MGVWDSIKTLTGNVPKAMLFVRNFSNGQTRPKNPGEKSDVQALRELTKSRGKTAQEAKSGQILEAAGQALPGSGGAKETDMKKLLKQLEASNFLAMQVQFNPNKIGLTTRAGAMMDYKSVGDAGRQQMSIVELTAATVLTVQLIFDRMNIQDAFVREGNVLTNPTVGNLVSTAQSIYTNAHEGYSVQPQTEGLIALLTHRETREVIFTWSEMFFHGMVADVSAQYTMFNKIGNPIRSTIDLTIKQSDSMKEFESDREYWDEAFNAAFGEAGIKMKAKTESAVTSALGGWF